LLDIFLSSVLAFHLICMNIASAGPLVCAWLDWRGGRGDEIARQAAKFLAWKALALLVVGGGFGLIVAAMLWDDAYHDLMHQFMYKIKWGGWELLFSLVLMTLHAVLITRSPARRTVWRLLRTSIAVLTATNLLYHFPVLFISISEVASGYLDAPEKVDAESFRGMMSESSVLARSVHFWVASFALTGMALMSYGKRLLKNDEQQKAGSRIAIWGARIAFVPTLLQILVGVWVISVLPRLMQQRLMGGNLLATGAFVLAIIGALALMHKLSAIAFGEADRRSISFAVHLMYVIVILMTYSSRLAMARPFDAAPANSIEAIDVR
jgi:hypothetical protein